jgi:large subunit ribosomal protein L16
MFEMAGVEESLAREAFKLASAKLPVKTHFLSKDI